MKTFMRSLLLIPALVFSQIAIAQAPDSEPASANAPATQAIETRTEFRVKFISGANIYIDGGRSSGLSEGTKLELKQDPAQVDLPGDNTPIEPGIVAELRVVSVATTSAVCDVVSTSRDLKIGDTVTLPQAEVQKLEAKRIAGSARVYPMVVSFTQGDPLDEEVRAKVPHPPLPEINQARGRIGFDTSVIRGLGDNASTATNWGMVVRADITRIHGSHWNLNGYWRGNLQFASTPSQPTIQDLLNRTYQMSLTYVNPQSNWTAGIGRLYVPWATSLEIIDGGYVARHLSGKVSAGIFGGTTPDPTAWNYDPNRQIGGSFLNVQAGTFEKARYSGTAGIGIDLLSWSLDRPFVFTENDFSYKRYFSVYHSMQIDRPKANPGSPAVAMGLGQSLLSVRAQIHPRVTLEMTQTYFRDIPTFDPILVGTGLLDKYLYQGLTGGARVALPSHVAVYFNVGSSSNSTDAQNSLNELFGVTVSNIRKTGLTVDARYSKFASAFATGTYDTLTISRNIGERLRLSLQGGKQSYTSTLTTNTGSYFANLSFDTNLGPHYFLESSYTTQRGSSQDYEQFITIFGFRFDNRSAKRRAALNALQSQHP
jgi:hypothetical protein